MAKTPTQIKSLARAHTESAVNVLSGIMNQTEAPPAARISAAAELLSRGWGRPTQPIAGDDDMDAIGIKGIGWLKNTAGETNEKADSEGETK